MLRALAEMNYKGLGLVPVGDRWCFSRMDGEKDLPHRKFTEETWPCFSAVGAVQISLGHHATPLDALNSLEQSLVGVIRPYD
jgi:hypothetical protein